jgi:hypothetical protein
MRKVNYETEQERDVLIAQAKQNGERLVEDAILINEKYLLFDTSPPKPPHEPEPTMEEILLAALIEIQELKQKIAELEGE